jgi:hypothetical protein
MPEHTDIEYMMDEAATMVAVRQTRKLLEGRNDAYEIYSAADQAFCEAYDDAYDAAYAALKAPRNN